MKQLLVAAMLVFGFLGAGAQDAFAQLKIYVQIDGIPGSSMDENHKQWIEARGLRQTMQPETGKTDVCAAEVLKGLDVASPRLWFAAAQGKHFKEVVIDVVAAGSQPVSIYKVRLEEVLVVGLTSEGRDAFVERVSLTAGKVEWTYQQQMPDGSVGGTVVEKWDCAKALVPF